MAPPSYYRPASGENFFLLSETSYGSGETASVRLEVHRESSVIEEQGGVDIAVYRIDDPIAFLRSQGNLHRVKVDAKPQPEGMANMLRLSWDKIWANSRYAWRHMFSSSARKAVTEAAPELETQPEMMTPTRLRQPPAYGAPPAGTTLADRFHYPVQQAQPIVPPPGVELMGSSSSFLPNNEGNIRVPIGKREPGLYLVEAAIGRYRAVTLVFVSDSIVVAKNTADEMLVWTADRQTGLPSADAEVFWSDGIGVLKSGKTDDDGIARLPAKSPETSYVFGQDAKGGVFISENFYHDSEIYNAKLYAVTDRPLYRPGDRVQVKFLGREFESARRSKPVAAGEIGLVVVDPAGTEILTRKVSFDAFKGGETDFILPEAAQAGGWELIFTKGEDRYGAAFRVANYVKPHFEVDIVAEKSEFKTKEAVGGRIRLSYPDGKPVAHALVRLTAKAQQISMVEGELRYAGQIPMAIKVDELVTDDNGTAVFSLPPSDTPARYILSVLAQDGTAYRVRANKEILIERGATLWKIAAPTYFSLPGNSVDFQFSPQGDSAAPANRPTRWEILRLEDQSRRGGDLGDAAGTVRLDFPQAGSYTISLRDANGNLLAATSHWVSGEGMKVVPGSVEIVFDKEAYKAGETAHALISFPKAVNTALLTLERDRVEAHALLGGKADWLSISRIGDAQWKADIPVKDDYGPNVTFSVLYVDAGDYVFQNKGLRVAVPSIEVVVRPVRDRYAPGEEATIEVETRLDGQPVHALVNLSVVDEMIYVLQPEIAPAIGDFFYHPRRNNVRTSVSLSFIGYDLARMPGKGTAPVSRSPSERGIKVLERPRRDDTDTAGWWPSLMTGQDGKASVSFRMPDALTRWRITARAMTSDGVVGQQTRHVESHQDFYAKWTGPASFRQGDQPNATVVAFNQTGAEARVQLAVDGAGLSLRRDLTLAPGGNNVVLPFDQPVSGQMAISLIKDDREVDRVNQPIAVLPAAWVSERSEIVEVRNAEATLTLPADARDVRVSLAAGGAEQFARIADDLVEFPWGCVEQTASRLLPLALVYRTLPADAPHVREIAQTLATNRLRLVHMAGPDARFGWWGRGTTGSGWLTAYAYYADWYASGALGLELPQEHWRQVLDAYGKEPHEPLPLSTLSVWFMSEMNLPVKNLVEGLVEESKKQSSGHAARNLGSNWLDTTSDSAGAMTLVLIGQLAKQQGIELDVETDRHIESAREALRKKPDAVGQALLAMEQKSDAEMLKNEAAHWLATIGPTAATLDRALALVWWNKALGGTPAHASGTKLALENESWHADTGPFGALIWRWTGQGVPTAIKLAASPIESPTESLSAFVRYRSAEAEESKLPVTVTRQLYRLVTRMPKVAGQNGGNDAVVFDLEKAADDELRSNELYLEEIRLEPTGEQKMRFGLIEVPLPPGADIERGTWGILLNGLGDDDDVVAMEAARFEPGELSYAVPVDELSTGRTILHLIRFGSRGHFVLPPARFHRMYQPQDKAFEAVAERHLKVD